MKTQSITTYVNKHWQMEQVKRVKYGKMSKISDNVCCFLENR